MSMRNAVNPLVYTSQAAYDGHLLGIVQATGTEYAPWRFVWYHNAAAPANPPIAKYRQPHPNHGWWVFLRSYMARHFVGYGHSVTP